MRKPPLSALAILLAWLLAPGGPTSAYELMTHAQMTDAAFKASQRLQAYMEAVGIEPTAPLDSDNRTKKPEQLGGYETKATPHDWMIEGAIREDDYRSLPWREGLPLYCPPAKNPPSQIDRLQNHFFDAQRGGRGLTVLGIPYGLPALDWALGLQGLGADEQHNQFTILDARVYQAKSLTTSAQAEREKNTALLFRTLGHVLHLLQDMTQPQHVRNDAHAGCAEVVAGEKSWYEDYTNTRARGIRYRTRGEVALPLPLGGYGAPRLDSYRDFWTAPGQKGLADFTSRNFFSVGTNLSLFGDCGGLAEPPCRRDAYTQQDQSFSYRHRH